MCQDPANEKPGWAEAQQQIANGDRRRMHELEAKKAREQAIEHGLAKGLGSPTAEQILRSPTTDMLAELIRRLVRDERSGAEAGKYRAQLEALMVTLPRVLLSEEAAAGLRRLVEDAHAWRESRR